MTKNILLTGGAGYIGSHTYIALVDAGYTPIILDNLCNSTPRVLERLAQITQTQPEFIRGDIRDKPLLDNIFAKYQISAVIHFAGLKAVGESLANPLSYYDNNVKGSIELFTSMQHANVKTLVFSSSATVYGDPEHTPIREDAPLKPMNPYGHTKLMIEEILNDLNQADSEWKIACLRYFNPVGAHESGLIGEDPRGIPNNLMPYIAQVATGYRECLQVFGGDYPTLDGTGIRDYIHVMDLAEGHVFALKNLEDQGNSFTINLGTGNGISVLQMIQAFEQASERRIPYKIVDRRQGDSAKCWADPTLAKTKLGWVARRNVSDMCNDSWRWQSNNPQGFN